ncbi:MAG: energy-coupling factor transporter transmembrane protein EcfT, partial [Clostridia bacterium]|nr:energy-coupling factor transporter transmembrane protein EcfT [Clostridia bacterium]
MLNNITIGQYFPAKSVIHRADPRIKILVTLLLIVTLFMAGNFTALLLCGGFTILSVLLTKIPLKMYLKTLKAIWMILFFTAILNIFYSTGEGDPL